MSTIAILYMLNYYLFEFAILLSRGERKREWDHLYLWLGQASAVVEYFCVSVLQKKERKKALLYVN